MNACPITITQGTAAQIADLMPLIPEFNYPANERLFDEKVIQERLLHKKSLLLVAWANGEPAGFKVGYERWQPHTFYSWLGGVLPQYRRLGIARLLAAEQEAWAKQNGYKRIVFTSRNRFTNMLLFALSNGFNLLKVQKADALPDYRIILQKEL